LSPEFAALSMSVTNEKNNFKMRQAVESGEVSTTYPLEIAQQNGHHLVARRLLLLTRINKSNGSVNWSNLHLVNTLDNYLINGLYNWVRVLDLSSNKLKCIPAEIEILTEVSIIHTYFQ
jgi:CHASE1-domain containing sensor protein